MGVAAPAFGTIGVAPLLAVISMRWIGVPLLAVIRVRVNLGPPLR